MDEAREVPDPPCRAVRQWVRRRTIVIRRQVHAGRVRVQRARRAIAERDRVDTTTHRFDGMRRTAAEIRALAGALAVVAHTPASFRPVRFVGRGLTLVNLAMYVVLYGHLLDLDGSSPVLGELLLALLLGACSTRPQLILALDVGRRLRSGADLRPAAAPPAPALVGAALLALTTGIATMAAYRWAEQIGSGPAAGGLGLLLAASALAAPFMIVADEVYGPGVDGRRLHRAERVLTRCDRRSARWHGRACRQLDAGDRALWRAECELAAVVDVLGAHHPTAVVLAGSLTCLRGELAAARAAHAGVVEPLGPDDVDLAG